MIDRGAEVMVQRYQRAIVLSMAKIEEAGLVPRIEWQHDPNGDVRVMVVVDLEETARRQNALN